MSWKSSASVTGLEIDMAADASGQPRPQRLIQRLLFIYGLAAAAVLLIALASLAGGHLPRLKALAFEVIASGLAGTVLGSLLLAVSTLAATLAMTVARSDGIASGELSGLRPRWRLWLADPGLVARQGQAGILVAGILLIWAAARTLWPAAAHPEQPVVGNVAAAFVLGFAFVSLVAERVVNAFSPVQLPEVPALHRLLLLVTVLLAAGAGLQLADGARLAWAVWAQRILICVPGLVSAELALRALGRLFLPLPPASKARAVADSIIVGILTGGPRPPATLLRTHFGLDFGRSWALAFVSRALAPALLLTALLCWGLSGLKLIEFNHRGVYERFGAPVAVLRPGLHLLPPWPLGKLQLIDDGIVHSVAVGVGSQPISGFGERQPLIGSEATPPLSYNRLWTSMHPDQAYYLVPSRGTGQLGFQSVDTQVFVLYKVGLTDQAALQSLYTAADPRKLIRDVADQVVLRYFDTRTLSAVLGARVQDVAQQLQGQIAAKVDAYHAGIDIVSILVEEIHPPVGAAAAYHAVQAAEINANASISDEIARAHRVAGVARQERHQLIVAADAQAVETDDRALGEAYRFAADRRASATGGNAFLLERYITDLASALRGRPLTLMDDRLPVADGPIIDMRPAVEPAEGEGSQAPRPVLPAQTPGVD